MFETKATINYSRCVVILIIFSSSIITEEQIVNMINIHSTLLFIWTCEKHNSIGFLDLLIVKEDKLEMNICRKYTAADITVHFNSNHHVENRLAAYCFCINWVHQLHLTPHKKTTRNRHCNTDSKKQWSPFRHDTTPE